MREVDIVELGDRERRKPHIGNVDEGVEAGARLRRDEAAERREIIRAGIPRRDAGGGALVGHELVGGNADRRPVRVHVRVEVDQSRRDQLAGGIEHAQRARRRNLGFHRLDHAIADADIAPAAQRLARIEHIAALDHKIELVVRPHRGTCRTARGGGEPA